MVSNCGAGEDSWIARRSNQSVLEEINPEYSGKTEAKNEAPILWPPDAESIHWKRS